jgi:hypothetical protein
MVAAISEPVIEQVREEWSVDPNISAREVARRFTRKYGRDLVRERKIIEIVGEAKENSPKEPFPLAPWHPWANREENPEDTFFALKMHHLKKLEEKEGLLAHEAAWARRLRRALEGLGPPHRQLEVVRTYAERERSAYYLCTTPYTEDLDAFITHQMWLSPAHQQRYEEAIAAGAAPVPFLGTTEPFLKELLAQGPGKVGEDVWDRLSYNPIFRVFQQLSSPPEDTMDPGWSEILLKYLDDPQTQEALLSSTTATTAVSV